MKDRIPTYPGRVRLTPVPGSADLFDMEMSDDPTQVGTPLNKATFLKDDTAAILGLTQADPTVDDAFMGLAVAVAGGAILRINVTVGGTTAIAGIPIAGTTDISGNALVTTGKTLIAKASGTSVTLSTPDYVDMPAYSQTVTIPAGFSGIFDVNFTIPAVTDGGYKQFDSSTEIQFSPYVKKFDVCCVGGGEAGEKGSFVGVERGGNGGSGGRVYNKYNIVPSGIYVLTVGVGGTANASGTTQPGASVVTLKNQTGTVATSNSGTPANYGMGETAYPPVNATAGSPNTTKVFGSNNYPPVGGGGGGGCLFYKVGGYPGAGGSPYGGAGGNGDTTGHGKDATGIGGGGGGGAYYQYGANGVNGGNGYRGAIFARWHY